MTGRSLWTCLWLTLAALAGCGIKGDPVPPGGPAADTAIPSPGSDVNSQLAGTVE